MAPALAFRPCPTTNPLATAAARVHAGLVAGLVLAGLALGAPTSAQTPGTINLELNTVESAGPECRVSLVVRNDTGQTLVEVSYETFIFDTDGIIIDSVRLDFGRLVQGRTRVFQFLLPRACAQLGRLHLNDALSCLSDGGQPLPLCLDAAETSSRVVATQLGL